MNTLMRTAKALEIFVKILQTIFLVAAIVLAVAIVMLAVFNVEAYEFSSSLEIGHFTFELTSFDPETVQDSFLWMALPAIAVLAVWYLIMGVIRRILSPMKDGKPFDTAVSVNLRKLSWITLIGGFAASVLDLISHVAMYRLFDFPSLFAGEGIASCGIQYNMDMKFVFGFLILSLFSCIFRYGEELQKQSDETL